MIYELDDISMNPILYNDKIVNGKIVNGSRARDSAVGTRDGWLRSPQTQRQAEPARVMSHPLALRPTTPTFAACRGASSGRATTTIHT